MVNVIRIVLALAALWFLQTYAYVFCTNWIIGPSSWDVSCVVGYIAMTVGSPLAVALIAWYFSKPKAIFWNTLVGGLVVAAGIVLFILLTKH